MLSDGAFGNAQGEPCEEVPPILCRGASAMLMEGTCPGSWILPSSGDVVSTYSTFLDPKEDCPQRQCWVAPSTQDIRLPGTAALAPVSALPPHTHSPVGYPVQSLPSSGSPFPSPSHRPPHPWPSWSVAGARGPGGTRGPPSCLCFLAAVQIHILKADKAGDWWKFTVNIISVYKQGTSRIRRGDQNLWIRSRDIACKCPKIKPLKKYLLLGNAEDSPDQSGIVADKSSLVIQWRDTWARRLRKFQQREKKGKCKKA